MYLNFTGISIKKITYIKRQYCVKKKKNNLNFHKKNKAQTQTNITNPKTVKTNPHFSINQPLIPHTPKKRYIGRFRFVGYVREINRAFIDWTVFGRAQQSPGPWDPRGPFSKWLRLNHVLNNISLHLLPRILRPWDPKGPDVCFCVFVLGECALGTFSRWLWNV